MAASGETSHYKLAKYNPDDITTWDDFNGNMDKIDETMGDLDSRIEEIVNSPDVRYIKETYAELDAVVKSTIGDQDYARVLKDETHGGDSTFYQFSKADQEWKYVGSAGSAEKAYIFNLSEYTTDPHPYNPPEKLFSEFLLEKNIPEDCTGIYFKNDIGYVPNGSVVINLGVSTEDETETLTKSFALESTLGALGYIPLICLHSKSFYATGSTWMLPWESGVYVFNLGDKYTTPISYVTSMGAIGWNGSRKDFATGTYLEQDVLSYMKKSIGAMMNIDDLSKIAVDVQYGWSESGPKTVHCVILQLETHSMGPDERWTKRLKVYSDPDNVLQNMTNGITGVYFIDGHGLPAEVSTEEIIREMERFGFEQNIELELPDGTVTEITPYTAWPNTSGDVSWNTSGVVTGASVQVQSWSADPGRVIGMFNYDGKWYFNSGGNNPIFLSRKLEAGGDSGELVIKTTVKEYLSIVGGQASDPKKTFYEFLKALNVPPKTNLILEMSTDYQWDSGEFVSFILSNQYNTDRKHAVYQFYRIIYKDQPLRFTFYGSGLAHSGEYLFSDETVVCALSADWADVKSMMLLPVEEFSAMGSNMLEAVASANVIPDVRFAIGKSTNIEGLGEVTVEAGRDGSLGHAIVLRRVMMPGPEPRWWGELEVVSDPDNFLSTDHKAGDNAYVAYVDENDVPIPFHADETENETLTIRVSDEKQIQVPNRNRYNHQIVNVNLGQVGGIEYTADGWYLTNGSQDALFNPRKINAGSSVNVVNEYGDSTEDAISQKFVSDKLDNLPVAIGRGATATGNAAVAIGESASATHSLSVAIGHHSTTRKLYEVSFGGGNTNILRTLSHVADGSEETDAVNLRQVNKLVAAAEAKIPTDTVTAAQLDTVKKSIPDAYTKTESDSKYALKTAIPDAYTKAEIDSMIGNVEATLKALNTGEGVDTANSGPVGEPDD